MNRLRSNPSVKAILAGGMVAAALAVTAGSLTAAGSINTGPAAPAIAAPATQTATRETPLYIADHPALFARAVTDRNAFGFPVGATRTARHVKDGIQGIEYDEVTEVDQAGHPMSIAQFAADGRLLDAMRLDSPSSTSTTVSSSVATKTALHALTASGFGVAGQPTADADQSAGGWDLTWTRYQAGYPVRGDGPRVHVSQDGHIESVATVQHKTGVAPTRLLTRANAQTLASKQWSSWFGTSGTGYGVQSLDVEWVGPNDTFDATRSGVTSEPYRLAWVASLKPSGATSDYLYLVTLYVDAGSGAVIGGDIVE